MAGKKEMSTPVKRYLEHEVRRCNEYRRIQHELRRRRGEGGAAQEPGDPFAAMAIKGLSERKARRLEEFLQAFDRNYENLPPDVKKVIDCAYRSPVIRNKTGVAMECSMHPATAYRIIKRFLTGLGDDLGIL